MNGLVYDTDHGRMCPRCRKPAEQCRCGRQLAAPSGDGIVRVRREVRSGKTVTVVLGLLLREPELLEVGKQLKRACGSGGTVKDGAIEIQGDHRDVVVSWLEAKGHTVKLAGG
jgi:translation initiation factor 1